MIQFSKNKTSKDIYFELKKYTAFFGGENFEKKTRNVLSLRICSHFILASEDRTQLTRNWTCSFNEKSSLFVMKHKLSENLASFYSHTRKKHNIVSVVIFFQTSQIFLLKVSHVSCIVLNAKKNCDIYLCIWLAWKNTLVNVFIHINVLS